MLTHSEGRFGADAMNKGAGNIWIICLPLVHSDSSWFWLDAVAELPYQRWGGRLESRNVDIRESEHAPSKFTKLSATLYYISYHIPHISIVPKAPRDKYKGMHSIDR